MTEAVLAVSFVSFAVTGVFGVFGATDVFGVNCGPEVAIAVAAPVRPRISILLR
jgi:hypothetical protein